MDIVWTLLIVLAVAVFMYGIKYMKNLNLSFNVRVITALILGIVLELYYKLQLKILL